MSLEQYPKLLSTLFLCDCQLVLAYGCGIDPDWQGKAGIKPNVRILRPEIFFCKQLQREAGNLNSVQRDCIDIHDPLTSAPLCVRLNKDIVNSCEDT